MKKTLTTLLIALLLLPSSTFAQFTKVQGGTGLSSTASGTLLLSTESPLRYTAISTTTLYNLLNITGGSGNSAWTIGNGLIYNATSSDLVGIGTSTPTYKLDVEGIMRSSGVLTDYIQFNTATTSMPSQEGLLQWNITDGTLDLGMDGGNITMQLGQELFTKVRNATGGTITNGTVVYFNGSLGNRPTIAPAISNTAITGSVQGIITEDILNNDDGFVTTLGYVRQIKTDYSGSGIWGTTWVEGDLLYVSKTNAGVLTNVEPDAPHYSDIVGSVGVVGPAGVGSILVNINRHKSLEGLSDVNGTPLTTTGQFPVWNASTGYFDFNFNINDYSSSSVRSLFSNTATGLTYSTTTGITSLTSGYIIPLTASTSEWHNTAWTTSGTSVRLATTTNNVGIGIAVPTQKLDVVGGYSLLNGLRISGADASNSIYQATGALGITTTSGNAISLKDLTNGVGLSVLNGSVTVGNGSALSNVKLNVTGTVTSANNAFGLYMGAMTLTPADTWDAYFQYAGGGAVQTVVSNTVPKAVAFYAAPMTNAGAGSITNTYGLYVANSTSGVNNYGGYFQGSVGIGTTTPFRSLQVGGGNANDYIRIASDSRRYDIGIGSAVSGDDKFTLFDATVSAFRLTVDTNGNLGIGTVSPNRKVEIVEPGGQLLRLAYDNTALANYDFVRNITTGALSLQGSQVGFNNIALAPTSGNVGIGTSTPTRKFVVEGIASGVASLLVNNAVGSEMSTINVASNNSYSALVFAQGGTTRGFFGANGSVALIPGAASGDFLVRSETGDMRFSSNTGTAPTLTLLRNQFVGIGTSTPTTQLQVTSSSTNATTTVTVGRSGMTKGSCLELYRADGSAIYAFVAAGATTFTLTTTSCK